MKSEKKTHGIGENVFQSSRETHAEDIKHS